MYDCHSNENNSMDCSEKYLGTIPSNPAGSTDTELYYGLTLSSDPSTKVGKYTFVNSTPDQQKLHLEGILKKVYIPLVDKIEYTFEYTKKLQLHLHAQLTVTDKPDYYDHILMTIRGNVRQNPYTIKLNKGSNKRIIINNYIHRLDKEGWSEYIRKHVNSTPYNVTTITRYI